MRLAAVPVQLALPDPDLTEPDEPWWDLPDATRASILALLARLIARGVLVEEPADAGEPGDG